MAPPPPADVGVVVDLPGSAAASPPRPRIVRPSGGFLRRLLAASGPGYLVAVGYMDPGNWATGIAAGSAFGYALLSVVIGASALALLLQHLSAKLGLVTGRDLAQACRARYGAGARIGLWMLCETAIVACELAEVLGAAIALKLLFHLPLVLGVVLTGLEVLLILALQSRGLRRLETLVISTMAVVGLCFVAELLMSRPDLAAVAAGVLPSQGIVTDPKMLYLAIGILGATVMPHNLYLHSATVRRRRAQRSERETREAIRFATWDVAIALGLALFVNAAILILAASTFHAHGVHDVVSLEHAFHLLAPTLGLGLASTLFAVALLASGQNASLTGAMAGQIVMEGFTDLRLPPWVRRLASRLLAILPAIAAIALYGEGAATRLLIFSQVVLSLQLPFAVIPLVRMTNDRALMGAHANSRTLAFAAWTVTATIVGMNIVLLLRLAAG